MDTLASPSIAPRDQRDPLHAGCRDEIALLLGEPGWRLIDAEPMVVTSFRLAE